MSTLELSQPGVPAGPAGLPCPPAVGSGADTAIRASTAAVVLAVAGIAAYISYWHAYAVVRQYGESGVTALLEPGTIDGLVYASSMVILHAARHRLPVPRLARWMLALGITASLAMNVAQGWSRPGRRGSGSMARRRAGGLLRTARLDDPDHGRRQTGPTTLIGPGRTAAGPAGTRSVARCFPGT